LTVRGIGPLLCQVGAERAKENWRQRLTGGGHEAQLDFHVQRVRHRRRGRFRSAEAASQALLEIASLFRRQAARFELAARVSPHFGLKVPARAREADQSAGHVFVLAQHFGTPLPHPSPSQRAS